MEERFTAVEYGLTFDTLIFCKTDKGLITWIGLSSLT